jgi:hypothetical protein
MRIAIWCWKTHSLDGARRNPGFCFQLIGGRRSFPDCASLHPGYSAYRSHPSNTGKLTNAASAISA